MKLGIHFQNLLKELGLSERKDVDVYEDNLSCRMSAESLKSHKKARHYQSKLRFLQDCYQEGLVTFHQTKTEHQTADIFTKSLPRRDESLPIVAGSETHGLSIRNSSTPFDRK